MIANDYLPPTAGDLNVLKVLTTARSHLRNRTEPRQAADGLDAVRQSLRWLSTSNLRADSFDPVLDGRKRHVPRHGKNAHRARIPTYTTESSSPPIPCTSVDGPAHRKSSPINAGSCGRAATRTPVEPVSEASGCHPAPLEAGPIAPVTATTRDVQAGGESNRWSAASADDRVGSADERRRLPMLRRSKACR